MHCFSVFTGKWCNWQHARLQICEVWVQILSSLLEILTAIPRVCKTAGLRLRRFESCLSA